MKRFMPLLLVGILMVSYSCKKKIYGCTDATADNYSDVATEDDGSCYTAVPYVPSQQLFMEEFTLTFGPGVAYDIYYPTFNYEQGDLIIIEVLSDDLGGGDQYWSGLPFVNSDIVFWGEYGELDGDIWVYTEYVSTGNDVVWTSTINIGFRAALVKKKMVIENPEIENMKISKIIDLQR